MTSTSDYIKSMYLDPKEDEDQNYLIRRKRKKRKIKTEQYNNVKIVDDDINLNQIKVNEDNEERFAPKEDKPTIENINDLSSNNKIKSTSSTWQTVQSANESDDDYDLSNLRRRKETKTNYSNQKNDDSDSDLDVRRRKAVDSDSDLEIERRKKNLAQDSDSDLDVRRRKNNNNNRTDNYDKRDKYHRRPEINESRLDNRHESKNENQKVERVKRSRSPSETRSRRTITNDRTRREYRRRSKDKYDERRPKSRQKSPDSEHNHHKSSKSKHRKNKKRDSESPIVKKINEISDSSDEDIREKLKRLYDDDNAKGKQPSKEDEELKAKYKKWSKGMKQIEDREKRLAEEEHEMNKPLARYKDDEDLDKHLKDQELIDDPMLEYFRKRKEEIEQQKQFEETGEVWVMPKYKSRVPPPINRYNIWPGYRWDGVDRGNGFEQRYLAKKNEKQANEEEDYKYRSLDM